MALHKWLMPRENIHYTALTTIEYGGEDFDFHITDKRIILYNRKGLIFKKEYVVAERLDDIQTLSYKEEGIIFKNGILQVFTHHKMMNFKGKPEAMEVIWQNLQQHLGR